MRVLLIILSVLLKKASAGAACYDGSGQPLCQSCGGACVADIGCYCEDYTTECVPQACIMESNDCCSMLRGWYYDPVQSCCTQEFQCTPRCASDEICVNRSSTAVCICNSTIYANIVTKDLKVTVDCDDATMTTSISKCQLQTLGFDFSSVHLIDPSSDCVYTYPDIVDNIRVYSLQVKAAIGWCGNIAKNDSNLKLYFTNNATIEGNSGPLIFKNPISYSFTCVYNITMQTILNMTLHPITSTISISVPVSGIGSLTVTLAAYTNEECTNPLQESDTVLVGSNIYLGLFSPDADGNVFALRAERCFATPSPNRYDTTNVQLVKGGCAVGGDASVLLLENGRSLEARIKISAFLFKGYQEVNIFCDVRICNKSEDCSKCSNGRSVDSVYTGLGIKLRMEDAISLSSSGDFKGISLEVLGSFLLALTVYGMTYFLC